MIESAEQTKAGVRYKSPKNGKGRTAALPAMVVIELRAHRLQQAHELLQLGVRLSEETSQCGMIRNARADVTLTTLADTLKAIWSGFRNSSGNLAKFAVIRRASS